MGCGSFEPDPAAPLSPGQLRVLDVQARAGGHLLATCLAPGPDERMDDLCVISVQTPAGPLRTPCVRADEVRGMSYVRLLLPANSPAVRGKLTKTGAPDPGPGSGRISAGEVVSYSLSPISPPVLPALVAKPGSGARPLLIVHSWASVLAWKLLRVLGGGAKAGKSGKVGRGPAVVQHAHSPDGFFLGLPGAARAVGEEQLALLVNEMLPSASYVLAIGPGWLAETAGALAAHYGCAGQFLVPRMSSPGVEDSELAQNAKPKSKSRPRSEKRASASRRGRRASESHQAKADGSASGTAGFGGPISTLNQLDSANLISSTPEWRDLDEAAPGAEKRGLGPESETDVAEATHARSAAHARVLEAIEQAAGDACEGQSGPTSPGQALDELLRSLGRGVGPACRLDGLLAESSETAGEGTDLESARKSVEGIRVPLESGQKLRPQSEGPKSARFSGEGKKFSTGKQFSDFPEVPISPATNGASR